MSQALRVRWAEETVRKDKISNLPNDSTQNKTVDSAQNKTVDGLR